jgi:hypothetical protein
MKAVINLVVPRAAKVPPSGATIVPEDPRMCCKDAMAHSCHAQSRNPAMSVRKISAQFAAAQGASAQFLRMSDFESFFGACDLLRTRS